MQFLTIHLGFKNSTQHLDEKFRVISMQDMQLLRFKKVKDLFNKSLTFLIIILLVLYNSSIPQI